MISRRLMFGGLAGLAAPAITGCGSRRTTQASATAAYQGQAVYQGQSWANTAPVVRPAGLDAVIDMSHTVVVTDFALAKRQSNVLAVIHKASEGGDWFDPLYAMRRSQAEAAGLLWGAYHFGTRQYSGADQARTFLAAAQPGPTTLIALDLEANDPNPRNTMRIDQAEAFVWTVHQMTGRWPLLYTHPKWADGGTHGRRGLTLGGAIAPSSMLARCDLWLADYREEPQLPYAWGQRGWRLWQYAGDWSDSDAAYGDTSRSVAGVDRCDRNLFAGNASELYRYWRSSPGRA